MNWYEQKQLLRKARQADRAERLTALSSAFFARAGASIEHIPPGQPILIGHYSERRHRADLARHDRYMRKAIELQKAAEVAAGRAASVSHAISSDDPDAGDKLAERIIELEAQQARMKQINTAHAAFVKAPGSARAAALMSALDDAGLALVRNYKPAYSWEPHPFAPYQISNLSANIRRLKDRHASLARKAAEPERPEVKGNGYTIREDKDENRLLILFDAIPPKATRERLKARGFRWSPSRGAWVRMLNNTARWAAEDAMGVA